MEALTGAIDELAGAELGSADDVVALQRELARLEAIAVRAVARFDASREWAIDGAKSASAWITAQCRIPSSVSHRRVALGRALRELPATEAAWRRGDVAIDHVSALARARNERTADALARDEAFLVGQARVLSFRSFTRVLAYWSQHADPDGVESDAERAVADRRLDLSQTFQGTWIGELRLDPIRGTIVSNVLRAIEEELFADDGGTESPRTPAQRRADALVEMAVRASTSPADGKRPAPLFTVLVGYETFAGRVCELSNRTVVTPGSLVPWLDGAYVERVVFDGPTRVIDIGHHRRLFVGATRRAVEVRDLECFHETCELPAEDCQIDHRQPWAWDGPTTQANGRPACGFHNRRRHAG